MEATQIHSDFVRGRNILWAHADFTQLFQYFAQHCEQHGLDADSELAQIFKHTLAAFALHSASRPRGEHISWTINMQRPLVNLFLVADTTESTVAGRFFTENVKVAETNSFFQEVVRVGKPLQRSYVDFSGHDPLIAAELFYEKSEQRPAKFFQNEGAIYSIFSAHPDYDEAWFAALDLETAQNIEKLETVSSLEKRLYRWSCGCSEKKIISVVAPMMKGSADDLFQGDEVIEVGCPRCAARYAIRREAVEAYLAELKD